jgi:hypothetical protein
MLLNPLMLMILAGISLLAGAVALAQTESLLSIIPFLVFTALFCLSLCQPTGKRPSGEAAYQTVAKPRIQLSKLTADRIRALGTVERHHHGTPVFRT